MEYYPAKVRELWERFRALIEPEGLTPIQEEAEEPSPTHLTLSDE